MVITELCSGYVINYFFACGTKDNLAKLALPDSRTLLVARFLKEKGCKTLNQLRHVSFLSRISYLAKITELYLICRLQ
jgi:hypothetical protein